MRGGCGGGSSIQLSTVFLAQKLKVCKAYGVQHAPLLRYKLLKLNFLLQVIENFPKNVIFSITEVRSVKEILQSGRGCQTTQVTFQPLPPSKGMPTLGGLGCSVTEIFSYENSNFYYRQQKKFPKMEKFLLRSQFLKIFSLILVEVPELQRRPPPPKLPLGGGGRRQR